MNTTTHARDLLAFALAFALALMAGCRPPMTPRPPSLCDAYPSKCVAPPPGMEPEQAQLGLVCCGPGGCQGIATNAECGPDGDIFFCAWGQQIIGHDGLPDVECFD